jgi:zeaxanthin glucosyltransferase
MSHFGVLSYKGAGHLNPLIALSRRLVARGHRVTFFLDTDLESQLRQQGLGFSPAGLVPSETEGPLLGHSPHKPSSEIAALRYRVRRTVRDMEMFLRESPESITRTGVDALLIDEIALAGPTVAEMLRLPYFVISTSVPHNFGWSAPRRIAPSKSIVARIQSALLEISVVRMKGPVRRRLNAFRRQAGLRPIREINKVFPELAHITQLPQCLDFARSRLPANFYYTGPFVDEAARPTVEFPWERLDGRRLIYASLGTTLKGDLATFHLIAEACDGLGLQLVISLGGRRDPEIFQDLPGDPLVVRNAPQLELLKSAEIVITHAGPNTALEALMQGKPMIALPKAFDQPAIAARLERAGVAEVLRVEGLSAQKIREALLKLMTDSSYRDAAKELEVKLRFDRGLERAASIIEEALESYANRALTIASGGKRNYF